MKYDRKLIITHDRKAIVARSLRISGGRPRVGENITIEFDACREDSISPAKISWLHNGREVVLEGTIHVVNGTRHAVHGVCTKFYAG